VYDLLHCLVKVEEILMTLTSQKGAEVLFSWSLRSFSINMWKKVVIMNSTSEFMKKSTLNLFLFGSVNMHTEHINRVYICRKFMLKNINQYIDQDGPSTNLCIGGALCTGLPFFVLIKMAMRKYRYINT